MTPRTFVLRPRPPVRAFAVSAITTFVGAAWSVGSRLAGAPGWVSLFGDLLLAFGIVLLVAAVLAHRRGRVRVEVGDEGATITDAAQARTLAWSQVSRITEVDRRIVFHLGNDERLVLIPATDQSELAALTREITRRMDASRGYGRF